MPNPTKVRVNDELDLPEARTQEELEAVLKRVYEEGLPGFVIRAAGLVDTGAQTHMEITQAVIDALPAATSTQDGQTVSYSHYSDPPIIRNAGTGDLHEDMWSEGDVDKVRVLKIKKGVAKAVLANSGPLYGKLSTTTSDLDAPTRARLAVVDRDFRAGLVDPDFVQPTIHATNLSENDHLVFPVGLRASPTHDKEGPIWHRVDTLTSTREAQAEVIEPAA